MKKIIALILASLMIAAMAFSAMSATITINQHPSGTPGDETYNLYKIFDVTKTSSVTDPVTTDTTVGSGTSAKGFSYTISTSSPWFGVLGTATTSSGSTVWNAAEGQKWVTLTPVPGDTTTYNVTWNTDTASTEAEAKAFAAWLLKNKPSTAGSGTTITASSGTATTTAVEDGYYLITSSLGTNLVLATSNIVITTKNSYPTTKKEVEKSNYNVGDFAKYTITVDVPASVDYTKDITVHDTMSSVLRLVASTSGDHAWSAKVGTENFTDNVTLTTGLGNKHDNSAHEVGTGEVGYDFVIDIDSLAPEASGTPVAKTITITYYAEVTSAAAADQGFINKEFVEYSKYTTPETPPVEVKTFDFDLEKIFTGNETKNLVATFNLYPTDSGSKAATPISFIDGGPVAGKNTTYVKVDSDDGSGSAVITVSTSGSTRLITNVRGLAAGTYYLTEVSTADGYNLLTSDIVVAIDGSGTVSITGATDEIFANGSGTVTVTNNSGTVLPSTGGIGTTIFYIVGGLLAVGAGVVLVTKKRMGKEEN